MHELPLGELDCGLRPHRKTEEGYRSRAVPFLFLDRSEVARSEPKNGRYRLIRMVQSAGRSW